MDPRLLITDIIFSLSALAAAAFAILAIMRGPKKTVNVTFFLMNLAIAGFQIAYLVGINSSDPQISRSAFGFTILIIPVVMLNVHNIAAFLGTMKRQTGIIVGMYIAGLAIMGYLAANFGSGDIFLKAPAEKLYFPNYFVPGSGYWLILLFTIAGVMHIIFNLIRAYAQGSLEEKRTIPYVAAAIAIAYGMGSLIFIAAYFRGFDPLISVLFGLYVFPLAYAVLKYEIFLVRIVARRAFFYAVFTIVITAVIGLVSLSNIWLQNQFPGFPIWVIPLVVSIWAVAVGAYMWEKIKEVDVLKSEFINVITHKFRLPMTYINWSLDVIANPRASAEEKNTAIKQIREANVKFEEFTNLLTGISITEEASYLYSLEKAQCADIVKTLEEHLKVRAAGKNIKVVTNIPSELPAVDVDVNKLLFALQTLIENAVSYTPHGGTVTLEVSTNHYVTFRIKDTGIGIKEGDLPYVFTKFFRSAKARTTDTEGMGIGLFMAKTIIERHRGKIWAESEGEGKGAIFSVRLPAVRE